jgi:spore coat polysaccharide biosynthesis protein SpsF
MRVVGIVQARMTSTRLPGKVLKEVLGKPLLQYELERLFRIPSLNDLVVATTENASDNPVAELASACGAGLFRGSEEDVLARYYGAAREANADVVVRFTADCPLIDPVVSEKVIRHYLDHAESFEYVSNTLVRSFPRGLDTEVFSFSGLDTAFHEAVAPAEREHVTPFLYRNPDRFRLGNVVHGEDLSHHRWTVDTQEDFELIRLLLEALYPEKPDFILGDVLSVFKKIPELWEINASVRQKMN